MVASVEEKHVSILGNSGTVWVSSQAGIEFGATEMSFSGFLRRLLGISCAVCEAASVLSPSVRGLDAQMVNFIFTFYSLLKPFGVCF